MILGVVYLENRKFIAKMTYFLYNKLALLAFDQEPIDGIDFFFLRTNLASQELFCVTPYLIDVSSA